jgi:tetratricopeptide (TPR) repeat protein
MTYLVQQSRGAINEQAPLLLKLQTATLAYANYLLKTIAPVNLAANYPLRPAATPLACVVCLAALACISATAILCARRGYRHIAVGWFWFLGMIVPVSGIVMIGDQSMADRYTYLSLTGLFIAVVFAAGDLLKGWQAVLGITASVAILALFAVLSFVQTSYWRDSETLWRHALYVAPDNALAHSNLAAVIHDRGPEGKIEAELHVAEALRLRPDDALANNNFGFQLAEKGDWEGAIGHYRIAIKSRPNFAPAHFNLGAALRYLRRPAEAESSLREALRLDHDYAKAENMLGDVVAMQGRMEEAVEHYRRAVELDPQVGRNHVDLGAALVKLGKAQGSQRLVTEGIERCKHGVAMNSDDPDAHNELANAYNAAGMTHEAISEWRETLKLFPGHPAALKQVGAILLNSRRPAEALKFLTAAEAADPRDIEIRRMKALAHALLRQFPASISEFREILKLDPNDVQALTGLAWFEATSPDVSIRNGTEAVKLAERATALEHPPTAHVLDVLAAAYAETGRYKEAVETAEKARQVAGASRSEIGERIKLYQTKKPYRDQAIGP